ncbi:MAG: hypothetical protein RIQ72_409 [Candidatus Parcubacteria bacterium]|jgi:hypothetical protein
MKIYFAGSIRGGREDIEVYKQIIVELQNYGEVLTEHIGDASLTSFGEAGVTDQFIFDRDMDWVRASNIVVAEVTNPSLGVGYKLGQAEAMGKKIICLYRKVEGKRLSAMISGNQYMKVFEYESFDQAKDILSKQIV